MKRNVILLFAGLLLVSCGAGAARSKRTAPAEPAEPVQYTYRVTAVHPHSATAYTQGLQYADGLLWEGTGQYGSSTLHKTDLATGRTEVVARLPRTDFGEGIALLDGKVYQLTWQSNRAYVYDAATGELLREHRYPGEGWGLTTDGTKLYLSDGTA
ncbi:MAG: glutaminyl-peptide cyclotransferase, partial [Alistipes sp.]|nr:glutaminyl-peptide cyclotransferase [Alistipes sp.]